MYAFILIVGECCHQMKNELTLGFVGFAALSNFSGFRYPADNIIKMVWNFKLNKDAKMIIEPSFKKGCFENDCLVRKPLVARQRKNKAS